MTSTVTEEQVREILSEVYTAEGVEIWLQKYQRDGMSARDLIASGQGDVILTRARYIAGGAW